jgi:hypothetical protein
MSSKFCCKHYAVHGRDICCGLAEEESQSQTLIVQEPLPGIYGIERLWAPTKEPPPMASTQTLLDACNGYSRKPGFYKNLMHYRKQLRTPLLLV